MAYLILKTGMEKGRLFHLSEDATTLGRNNENNIVVPDMAASRFHARIERRDRWFFLQDLQSSHGAFVNDERIVGEVLLRDNDRVRIGNTGFLFRAKDAADSQPEEPPVPTTLKSTSVTPKPVPIDKQPASATASTDRALPAVGQGDPHAQAAPDKTGRFHEKELNPKTIHFSVPSAPAPAAERALSRQHSDQLSRVADAIRSVAGLEDLLKKLIDVIFDVFHPDRGVILLYQGPENELVPRVQRPEGQEIQPSRTILNHALRNRQALLVADMSKDARFRQAQSIMSMAIQAAICCPLVCRERTLGALYIDAKVNLLAYRKEDLALINIIATHAAIAIENALLLEEKIRASRLADDEPGPIVAYSPPMRQVEQKVGELAREKTPLLITGEAGAGKLFAAKAIHRAAGRPDAPFLVFDCAARTGDAATNALFGSERSWPTEEDIEDATDAAAPSSPSIPRRTDSILWMADGGTLVLRHVGALNAESQEVLARYLEAVALSKTFYKPPVIPRVRVIATTAEDLDTMVAEDRFFELLARRISAHVLAMPPLRERKQDILPLARYFLGKCDRREHEYEQQFTGSAEFALRKLQYRNRNAAELREAVELASLIADGPEISGEHIFSGATDRGRRAEFNLGETPFMAWIVKYRIFDALQVLVLLFFLGIAALCLAAGDTLAGRVANGLVWGLWWPALIVLFLFVGRVWCPFCPISMAGRIARKLVSFGRKPPPWMNKHTGWLMALLFLAIVWSEHVFHMPAAPPATGFFLLTLMTFSVVLCVLYQREVWCRYLCPLGSLSATYSVSSILQVHSNSSICASECKTHECFKGSETESGCPMFHHPLYLRDAHFCKLCLACLRSCPHDSVRPFLRPPLQNVWRLPDLSATLIPFALTAFCLSIVMLASRRAGLRLAGPAGFSAAAAIAVALAAGFYFLLPGLLTRDRNPVVAARVSFALLILAWGPFMAFHLENIPGLDTFRVSLAEGSLWARYIPAGHIDLRIVLQLMAILFGALLAAFTLWRIRAHAPKEGSEPVSLGWKTLAAFCALYFAAAVILVIMGVPVS